MRKPPRSKGATRPLFYKARGGVSTTSALRELKSLRGEEPRPSYLARPHPSPLSLAPSPLGLSPAFGSPKERRWRGQLSFLL